MKHFILTAFFIAGIALIEACSCFTSCGCGGAEDVLEYFDFKKMTVEATQGIGAESLRIKIQPDSISFLALQIPELPPLRLTSAAYGCSPNDPGYSGLKFPLTTINITANQTFNDTLPEGNSLNALFLMTTEPYINQPDKEFGSAEVASLDALEMFQPFRDGYYDSSFFLVTKASPSNPALPFKFTITLSKSDGSSVVVTTDAFYF